MVDGRKVLNGHSCMGRLVVEDSLGGSHRNRDHDGLEGNHPWVVHVLLVANGHNVHGPHSSHGVVVTCHGIFHHALDCIRVVVHDGHSHPLDMVGDLGSEIELANHEERQVGSESNQYLVDRITHRTYVSSASDAGTLKFTSIELLHGGSQVRRGFELNKASVLLVIEDCMYGWY